MNGIGGFLSNDSPFGRLMTKCGIVIAANVMFAVCIVPLITAGAAIRGLYGTMFAMLCEEDTINPFRVFWQNFRRDFLRTTLYWGIFLGILMLGSMDLQICAAWPGVGKWLSIAVIAVLIAAMVLSTFFFPLRAVYEEKPAHLLRRALMLAVGHPLRTIGILMVHAVPLMLVIIDEVSRPAYAFAAAFFAFGIIAWITAKLLLPQIQKDLAQ